MEKGGSEQQEMGGGFQLVNSCSGLSGPLCVPWP